jgi:D-glycero-D-manno-heptose 1,7-bisphosphate phosphatase
VSSGRTAVFLDRDGTINVDVDFLRTPDQFRLIVGAAEAIRELNRRGVVTCVVTNQSGIARGLLSEADLGPIHETMRRALDGAGAHVDRIEYCPHHPDEGVPPYNVACGCRKPRPGMLTAAADALDIDLARSYMVGDRIGDIEAGHTAGARTVLVLTGNGMNAMEECRRAGVTPDAIAPSLREAVEIIVRWMEEEKPEPGVRDPRAS